MKVLLFGVFLVGAAFAQSPADHGAETARPTGGAGACVSPPGIQNAAVLSESERRVAKLYLAAASLVGKYEQVRQTPSLQQLTVQDGPYGAFIKKVLVSHSKTFQKEETVAPLMNTTVLLLSGGASSFAFEDRPKWMTRTGWSSLGTAGISLSYTFGTRSFGSQALKWDSTGLDLLSQVAIQHALESEMGESVKDLGEILGWTALQKSAFAKALESKVNRSLIKSVQGVSEKIVGYAPLELNPRVLADLAPINLLELLEESKLASDEDIASLKALQQLHKSAQKVITEMTPEQAQSLLSEVDTVTERVKALGRLHKLLTQMEKELPGDDQSPAKQEVKRLVGESARAMDTIKKLCELDE